MGGRTWKEADLARLAEMIEQGLPHHEIASILGRTQQAVSNRCQVLGLRNKEASIRNAARAMRADPEKAKLRAARISATWTPERRQRQAEIARQVALDHPAGSLARQKAAESRSNTVLGWCPPRYRDEYRTMVYHRGIPAAKARQIILARAREDKCARIAVTHASIAADYLRRLAPVYRKGDGWQLGTVTLTPAQLIDRAMRRGWMPEDWSVAA